MTTPATVATVWVTSAQRYRLESKNLMFHRTPCNIVHPKDNQCAMQRWKKNLFVPINSSSTREGQVSPAWTTISVDVGPESNSVLIPQVCAACVGEDPRGSARLVDLLVPRSRNVRSYLTGGKGKGGRGFRAFRASLRIMYTVVGHRPAPRPLGYRRYHD